MHKKLRKMGSIYFSWLFFFFHRSLGAAAEWFKDRSQTTSCTPSTLLKTKII